MVDINNLSAGNFKFTLGKTPNFEYNVQKANLPGILLGTATVPSPFVQIPLPGNLSYEDLTIDFMVAEHMGDYLDIFNWMIRMGQPEKFGTIEWPFRNNMTDATLTVLDNSSQPILNANFIDLYPVSLSGLNFDTTISGTQYVSALASFKFLRYDITIAT